MNHNASDPNERGSNSLRIAHISFYLDPLGREPHELLEAWPSLVDVAEAAHRAGAHIQVLQAAKRSESIERNGVRYAFIEVRPHERSIACGEEFARTLATLSPEVLHVHGLGFPSEVLALARLLPATPILLQDHANRPPRLWRRGLWRRSIACAHGVAFCARELARPFIETRVLHPTLPILEIPESSSHFIQGDREAARAQTGLQGSPCVLWVGHLNQNKDPLTVIEAVRLASASLPDLELWCCFGSAPLLAEVERAIDREPRLKDRVHLLGRVAHERVETLMRAADVFVLASHCEGSGYALIEALACGMPVAVSDIPSFRALTANGTLGSLFPCGDAERCAQALIEVSRCGPAQDRVRSHFEAELSFDAVGRKLLAAYRNLCERSQQRSHIRHGHTRSSIAS